MDVDHDVFVYPPLTTIFKPPAACNFGVYLVTFQRSGNGVSEYFGFEREFTNTRQCLPTSYSDAMLYGDEAGLYSPGVCPSGYTAACSTAPTFDPRITLPVLAADEIHHQCCPLGYVCTTGLLQCISSIDIVTFARRSAAVRCYSDMTECITEPLDPSGSDPWTTATGPVSGVSSVLASAIHVRFRNSDRAFLPEQTAAPDSDSSNPSNPSNPSDRASDAPSTSESGSPTGGGGGGGMPQATKIAIGVAVPLVVLSFVLGLYLGICRRRQKNVQYDVDQPIDAPNHFELPSTAADVPRAELDPDRQVYELGRQGVGRHELV